MQEDLEARQKERLENPDMEKIEATIDGQQTITEQQAARYNEEVDRAIKEQIAEATAQTK